MQTRFWATAAILLTAFGAPFAADAAMHLHRHHRHVHSVDAIYLHNYGPPDFYPGTNVRPDRVVYPENGRPYGIYDGFGRHCEQSAANYRGQDGRRHPCN